MNSSFWKGWSVTYFKKRLEECDETWSEIFRAKSALDKIIGYLFLEAHTSWSDASVA